IGLFHLTSSSNSSDPSRGFNVQTLALLPVARLKQVAQWVAEAREQVLPFEEAAAADELSAGRSAADLCALGVRINDPRKLCAAFEEVLEPLVNFGAGVIW